MLFFEYELPCGRGWVSYESNNGPKFPLVMAADAKDAAWYVLSHLHPHAKRCQVRPVGSKDGFRRYRRLERNRSKP